jgi:hypothetical protein
MTRRQTTEEWLREAIDDKTYGECYAVAAVHYVGTTAEQVDRVTLVGGADPREIALRFEKKINNYVRDMAGPQQCAWVAFYGTNDEPEAKQPFVKNGKVDFGPGGTEQPTERGVLQQLMRHHENQANTFNSAQKQLMDGLVNLSEIAMKIAASASAENQRLREENADAYRIVRDVATTSQREAQDRDLVILKQQRADAMLQKVMLWAPALVNTIFGKKVFPESQEDSAIVNGLLDAMGPEHINILLGILHDQPQIAGVVATRAKELMKRREAHQLGQVEARALADGLSTEGELQ